VLSNSLHTPALSARRSVFQELRGSVSALRVPASLQTHDVGADNNAGPETLLFVASAARPPVTNPSSSIVCRRSRSALRPILCECVAASTMHDPVCTARQLIGWPRVLRRLRLRGCVSYAGCCRLECACCRRDGNPPTRIDESRHRRRRSLNRAPVSPRRTNIKRMDHHDDLTQNSFYIPRPTSMQSIPSDQACHCRSEPGHRGSFGAAAHYVTRAAESAVDTVASLTLVSGRTFPMTMPLLRTRVGVAADGHRDGGGRGHRVACSAGPDTPFVGPVPGVRRVRLSGSTTHWFYGGSAQGSARAATFNLWNMDDAVLPHARASPSPSFDSRARGTRWLPSVEFTGVHPARWVTAVRPWLVGGDRSSQKRGTRSSASLRARRPRGVVSFLPTPDRTAARLVKAGRSGELRPVASG